MTLMQQHDRKVPMTPKLEWHSCNISGVANSDPLIFLKYKHQTELLPWSDIKGLYDPLCSLMIYEKA